MPVLGVGRDAKGTTASVGGVQGIGGLHMKNEDSLLQTIEHGLRSMDPSLYYSWLPDGSTWGH